MKQRLGIIFLELFSFEVHMFTRIETKLKAIVKTLNSGNVKLYDSVYSFQQTKCSGNIR